MRTIAVIAAREIYDHWRSATVLALVLVAAILSCIAGRVGAQRFTQRAALHAQAVEQLAAVRARPQPQNVGWQIEPALRVLRHPSPLSTMVSGLEAGFPVAWDFGPAGSRSGRPLQTEPDLADLGERVDLEFIVRILLGLLAIAIAVQSVADERARGTLVVLFAQPVSPSQVLAGKLLGGVVTLAAALTLTLGGALIASVASTTIAVGDVSGPLALFAAGAMLYLVVCLAFAVLLSAALASHRGAMLSAILIWALAVVVLPGCGLLVKALVAVDPASIVEARLDAVVQARTQQVQIEMGDALAAQFGLGHDWTTVTRDAKQSEAALQVIGPIWVRHARNMRQLMDAEVATTRLKEMQRNRLVRAMALFSPAAQFTLLATSVTGVGDPLARRWREAVARHQARLNDALFDDRPRLIVFVPNPHTKNSGTAGRTIVAFSRRATPALDALPPFDPVVPSGDSDAFAAMPQYLVLAVYAAGLVAGSVLAFEKLSKSPAE